MRPRSCQCRSGECTSLAELCAGRLAFVTCNNDIKTIERGLYHGQRVSILRNEPGEPNIVVAVGEARYALDRRIAALIRVRVQ